MVRKSKDEIARPVALDIPQRASSRNSLTSSSYSNELDIVLDPNTPPGGSPRTPLSPDAKIFQPVPDVRHEKLAIHPAGDLDARYKMQDLIGQGGYGVVHKATSLELGQVVAIKSVNHSHLESEDNYDKELVFAWKVEHPYLVVLMETFQDDKQLHFVMEYCSGGPLAKRVHARRLHGEPRGFRPGQTKRYIWEMLSGIAYLHHHKIVHRDCKPDNYLFANTHDEAPLILIDFGLACRVHKDTVLTEKVGTPDWTAPEVLTGSYNERCDIWSIGAVSYLCCVGFPPFSGATAVEVLKNIRDKEICFNPLRWDLVGNQAKGIVQAMLVKDPAKRPSANDLAQANEGWLKKVKSDEEKLAGDRHHCCVIG